MPGVLKAAPLRGAAGRQ